MDKHIVALWYLCVLLMHTCQYAHRDTEQDDQSDIVSPFSQPLTPRVTAKELWQELPASLQVKPRLIVGHGVPEYIRTRDRYVHKEVEGIPVAIDKTGQLCYIMAEEDSYQKATIQQKINKVCSSSGLKKQRQFADIHLGMVTPRETDLTLTINGEYGEVPHIEGNAWNPNTLQNDKLLQNRGKLGAIIIDRMSAFPLYWGAYFRAFFQERKAVYQLPSPLVREGYYNNDRVARKRYYDQHKRFYYPTTPVLLKDVYPSTSVGSDSDQSPDPGLVIAVLPSRTTLKYDNLWRAIVPKLDQVLQSTEPSSSNIFEHYFQLLTPGGRFIYASYSSRNNRHGGCVFSHNGHYYSLFKDLDDPNMQSVYRSVLERAGFINIQFYKDICYSEDCVTLSAQKPD